MHRRCFNQFLTECLTQIKAVVLAYFFGKNPHTFAGAANVASRRIVPAFNHSCHTHNQIVMHFNNMFCLFSNLLFQILIKMIDQIDVLLVGGIIRQKQLIASIPPSVEQFPYRNEIGTIFSFI